MGIISHRKPAFTKKFRASLSLQFNLPYFTEESWGALNCRQIQASYMINFVFSETLYNGHSAYSWPMYLCVTASVVSCSEWEHKIQDMEGTPKICTAVSAYQQVLWSKAAPPSAYCYSAIFRNFQCIKVRFNIAQCQNPNTAHYISQSWTYLPEFDAQHVRFTTGSPAVHNGYPTPQFGCADIFCLLWMQM